MRITLSTFGALLALSGSALSGQTIVPEVLQVTQVQQDPYKYNGLIYVGSAIGSASMVGEGVFATAAHVIFDDDELAWEPIARTFFYPRFHRRMTINPTGTSYQPVAFSRWTSYATRVENDQIDGTPAGQSTPDTFNLDFAVGYVSKSVSDTELLEHPEVHVDKENEVGIFRDPKLKMIVGYPTDTTYIDSVDRGFMHHTEAADYFCWWGGLSDLEQTWHDSEDFWVSMYDFEGVTTYGGNSGGPMYVQDVEGVWAFGGVVVGSDSTEGILVRAVDEEAWTLIETAISARWDNDEVPPVPMRVVDLSTLSVTQGSVNLIWTDSSNYEDGYTIFRSDSGEWIELASLPADAEGYVDDTVHSGHIYQYRVQPFTLEGNAPPKSESVTVATPGSNSIAGNFLGQWALKFSNSGDSNWYVDPDDHLRAGQTRSQGTSSLGLEIIGPGTLTFSWSVSSELNLDYTNPESPYQGDIYDAILLNMDGEDVMDSDKPVFLSGLIEPQDYQLSVPSGEHLIEWIYKKDPYTSEGEDTGFIESLTWNPGPDPYPVYGAFQFSGSEWHGSNWFGNYFAEGFPWVGHSQLGWLYLFPGDGFNLYFYSVLPQLGNLFTTPNFFPYVYKLDTGDWIYIYPGTGNYGSELWIFDLTTYKAIQIP